MVLIAPSILSADFADLKNEIIRLDEAGADMIHLDIMDGNYVPNLTFGPDVVKALRPYTKLPFDVHLMVENPDCLIPLFVSAGADIITVHAETCPHFDRTLKSIKRSGLKAGAALNPATPEQILTYVLDDLDQILVMTVNPGFGGQNFIPAQLAKISSVRKMTAGRPVSVEVDGGINAMTGAECVAAGANILVAGTAVFTGRDYQRNIAALR